MNHKKKNYNPFTMWFPYVLGAFFILLLASAFFFGFTSNPIITFFDLITPGDLYKVVSAQTGSYSLAFFNPLAVVMIFFYGFILGYIIQSIARFFRNINK